MNFVCLTPLRVRNFVYLTPLRFMYCPKGLSMAPGRSRFRPTDGIAGYALFPASRP